MIIFVKISSIDKTLTLEVDPTDTILIVYSMIYDQTGIDVNSLNNRNWTRACLSYGFKPDLDTYRTLMDYNIQNQAWLELKV